MSENLPQWKIVDVDGDALYVGHADDTMTASYIGKGAVVHIVAKQNNDDSAAGVALNAQSLDGLIGLLQAIRDGKKPQSQSTSDEKTIREIVDEHGDPARERWRTIFDKTRETLVYAKPEDDPVKPAATVADDTVRAEVERGVLAKRTINDAEKRALALVSYIAEKRVHPTVGAEWLREVVDDLQKQAREIVGSE